MSESADALGGRGKRRTQGKLERNGVRSVPSVLELSVGLLDDVEDRLAGLTSGRSVGLRSKKGRGVGGSAVREGAFENLTEETSTHDGDDQHRLLKPTSSSRVEHKRLEDLAVHRCSKRRQARVANLLKEVHRPSCIADTVALDRRIEKSDRDAVRVEERGRKDRSLKDELEVIDPAPFLLKGHASTVVDEYAYVEERELDQVRCDLERELPLSRYGTNSGARSDLVGELVERAGWVEGLDVLVPNGVLEDRLNRLRGESGCAGNVLLRLSGRLAVSGRLGRSLLVLLLLLRRRSSVRGLVASGSGRVMLLRVV